MEKNFRVFLTVFFIFSCAARVPHTLIPDYAKKTPRLIAVMPFENKTQDQTAAKMLREKMVDELYFKGYPKIPLNVIDAVLLKDPPRDAGKAATAGAAKEAEALLQVDAVLYCTLNTMTTSKLFLYAPTSLSITCELKSKKTEEILWTARYHTVERNFGYSRNDLQLKTAQTYETVIQKAVSKVVDTLPDGPDLLG